MNIGTRINGNLDQTNNGILEKYCYNNKDSNCNIYGGLYQWGELVQYLNGASNTTSWNPDPTGNVQGICPTGWHIPMNSEMDILANFLGSASVTGGPLKEAGTLHWQSPNTGATNSSGFTGLPGGQVASGSFSLLQSATLYWEASQDNNNPAWDRSLNYNDAVLYKGSSAPKSNGVSVRCIKN